MNQTTLAQIWIRIAKDMVYGSQINTVFVIDDPPDVNLDTFGATYQHYLGGVFWSRDWVNGGANPNQIKGQFPALFIEQITNTVECLEDSETRTTWAFVIVDKLPCDTCPNPSGITVTELKDRIFRLLRSFMIEFQTFQRWSLTIDAEPLDSWFSEGRKAYLETLPGVVFISMLEDIYSAIVAPDEYTISEWGNMPLMRGYTMSVVLEWCEDLQGVFDYTQTDAAKKGVVTCC